jgi:hypothetical protein
MVPRRTFIIKAPQLNDVIVNTSVFYFTIRNNLFKVEFIIGETNRFTYKEGRKKPINGRIKEISLVILKLLTIFCWCSTVKIEDHWWDTSKL